VFPKRAFIPVLATFAACAALAACGREPPPQPDRPQAAASEAYDAPPQVTAVRLSGRSPRVEGTAEPGAQVRLATPAGAGQLVAADAGGRWRLDLAPSGTARIFGLSALAHGRRVQSQGYVLIGPQGAAALLRAGAGAQRLDPARGPRVGAFDFDREGGAVVSGAAPPRAWLSLRLDGRQAAEGRAEADGRYAIALSRLTPGLHTLQVVGDGFTDAAQVSVTPAAPLVAGPMRSQFTRSGLRVDWLTPGGGEQSTILLN
jgi:hypothetical protein